MILYSEKEGIEILEYYSFSESSFLKFVSLPNSLFAAPEPYF